MAPPPTHRLGLAACRLGVVFEAVCGSVAPHARAEQVPRAAHASPPPESARAAVPGAPVSIWYRSSEGCPDGAAFIARLSALGRQSALANVGDHIDFVVTLAARLTMSAGRLERQTARGTVAIRELEAARCEEVAEALALSLELALEPRTEPAASVSAVPGDTPRLPNDAAARPSSERTELPAARTLPAALDATPPAASGESSEAEPPFRFGAQGRVATGITPAPAPGAALFVELGDPADEVAARLSLNGVYRETTVASVELDVAVVAARLDGCALGWRTGVFSIRPCVGLDVGLLAAGTSGAAAHRDRGLWASATGLLRARWRIWRHVAPEIQLGVLAPFVRYAMGSSTGADLFRTDAVGLEGGLGARWSP
jgi:hypothetical protein